MTLPEIRLPSASGQQSIVIKDCFAKLVHFVEQDAYVPYDYWITARSSPPDTITWDHVYATNNAMRARSSRTCWAHFIDQIVPEMAAVPQDIDLIDGPEAEVSTALDALVRNDPASVYFYCSVTVVTPPDVGVFRYALDALALMATRV